MHCVLDDEVPGCTALRAAKRLVRTDGQIEMVRAEEIFTKCP
jgi:hypothetical protein